MARVKQCNADDVVLDILDRIALKVGILPKKISTEIERDVRREWGGEAHYIAKQGESARAELHARNQRIRADHRRGEPIPLLSRRYGISQRRVQQIVAPTSKET